MSEKVSVRKAVSPADRGRLERARLALQQAEIKLGVKAPSRQDIPLTASFSSLVPAGIPQGSVISVRGSTTLLMDAVSGLSQQGAWIAVIGMPDFGYLSAQERGIELSRVAAIPQPGIHAAAVVSAALDGFDVVLLGEHLSLTTADKRRLNARVRERNVTIAAAGSWPQAEAEFVALRHYWSGLEAGYGRLKDLYIKSSVAGKRVNPATETLYQAWRSQSRVGVHKAGRVLSPWVR